jgi:hypothetical protein
MAAGRSSRRPLPCSLAPAVTTPLYSTTVSRALRQPLRREISETRVLCLRQLPARMWRCREQVAPCLMSREMSPQPGTPFFGIITIPTSLCRGGNGDDRYSEVYRARQTSEKVHVDPPESNLSESEAPRYARTINLARSYAYCASCADA